MWVLYLWLDKNLENKKNREKKCFFRRRQRESCPRKFSSATFQLKQIAIVPQHRIPARFLFAANCALTECRVLIKLCKIIHISLHKKTGPLSIWLQSLLRGDRLEMYQSIKNCINVNKSKHLKITFYMDADCSSLLIAIALLMVSDVLDEDNDL